MRRICLIVLCASLCYTSPHRKYPQGGPLLSLLGPEREPIVIRSFDGRDVFKNNDTACKPDACELYGAASTDNGNCRCRCNEDVPVFLENEGKCSEAWDVCNIVLPYNLTSETQRAAPVVEPPDYNQPIPNTRLIEWNNQNIDPVQARCQVKSASFLGMKDWEWNERGTLLFTIGTEKNNTVLFFTGNRHSPDYEFVTGKLFKIELECPNHKLNGSLCILLRMVGGNKGPPQFGGRFGEDRGPRFGDDRGPRFGDDRGPRFDNEKALPLFSFLFGGPNGTNNRSSENPRDRRPYPSEYSRGRGPRPFLSPHLERRQEDIKPGKPDSKPDVGPPILATTDESTPVRESSLNIVLATALSTVTVLLILIMAAVGYYKRKTRKRRFKHVLEDSLNRKMDNWETTRPQLEICFDKKLGSGTFGAVYKGNLHGEAKEASSKNQSSPQSRESSVSHKTREVAVKMLPEYADAGAKSDFLQEINLMKSLGSHPHVVSILGCITIDEPLCLIVEYCSEGDLLHFLRSKRGYMENQKNATTPDLSQMLSMKELLSFGWQTSDGMEYIANKKFVHRDVAARNVMVDQGKTVKIGDFGLTRFILGSSSYFSRGGRFPVKWMAPESIRYNEFTTRSDIWSFGILLFEIITLGNAPYSGMHPAEMEAYLYSGKLMDKPEECPENLFELMKKCWTLKTEERPTFTWIKEELRQMLETATEDYSYLKLDENSYRTFCSLSHSSSYSSAGSEITMLRISGEEEDLINDI